MSFETCWLTVPADEFCAKVADGTHDSPKKADRGKYLITSRHLKGYQLDYQNAYLISEEDYREINRRSKVDQWDILFSMIGTVGETYLEKQAYVNYAIKNVGLFKFHGDQVKARWMYYYLKTNQAKEYILTNMRGSTQQYVPLGALRKMPVSYPTSKKEMKRIVETIGIIDDKIELNNAINKNLEEMAQALFKRWFVDFEFPNENGEPYKSSGGEFEESELGLIPKGWRVLDLEEIIEINPKRVLKKGQTSSYVEMKSLKNNYARVSEYVMRKFSSGSRFANGDVLLARITPCLENGKTAYVDFLKNDEVGWGSTEFIVMRSRPPISSEFSYFLARSEQFRSHAILSMTGSSGRQRVPESSLSKYQIALPLVGELISTFEGLTKSALKLMKKNDDESKRLAQIRDTLLPKLMSGEIRVPVERDNSATELPMVAESSAIYQP